MIILGLNSLKNLHLSTTTNNYQGEDGFEKVKIVVSEQISEHNAKDCNFECYVYDVDENGKEIFNNCIPFELTDDCRNANGNYCYEFDLDARYTTATKLGFYLHIYYRQNNLGKSNEVTTSILKHKSSDIGLHEGSIGLFEKYKSDMQKIIQNSAVDISQNVLQKVGVDKRRVWFKKNCPNWTTPRIYLFTNRDMTNYEAPCLLGSGASWFINDSIWLFEDSPYMIKDENEEDLYYYDIPICQHRNIIFFCDKKDGSFYYKTHDLVIPQGYLYDSLYYWQSPIGYDGIWADKETNSFKLFIQYGRQYEKDEESFKISVKIDDIDAFVYNLGILGCGGSSLGYRYRYINVPLTSSNVYIHIKADYTSGNVPYKYELSKSFDLLELCYNYSGIYQYRQSDLYNYDISRDEIFMFQTRYSTTEYQLYRDAYKYFDIYNMSQSLYTMQSKVNTMSNNTPTTAVSTNDFGDKEDYEDNSDTYIRLDIHSVKIRNSVYCIAELFFWISTLDGQKQPTTLTFKNALSYARKNPTYQPISIYLDSSNSISLKSEGNNTNVILDLTGAYNSKFKKVQGYYGYGYGSFSYLTTL